MMKFQRQSVSNKASALNNGLFQNGRIRAGVVSQYSDMAYRQMIPEVITQEHQWVGVLNPRNQRSLLEACDDCGIVKSENSISRNCRATPGQNLISSARLIM